MQETLRNIQAQLAVLETLLENAPVGFAFVDKDFRFVRINKILADEHIMSIEDHIGKTVEEVVPEVWPDIEPFYRRALAGDVVTNQDFTSISNTGEQAYWLLNYYPVRIEEEVVGVGIIVNSVTERRAAEEALKTRTSLYAMLSATSRAINRCRSRDDLFREVCNIAVEIGQFRCAYVLVRMDDQIQVAAYAGEHNNTLENLVIKMDGSDPRSGLPGSRCILTNQAVIINDAMTSPVTAEFHEFARLSGIGASAAFPIMERGQVVAALSLPASTAGFFTDELVATMGEIIPSISSALDGFLLETDRNRAQAELRQRDRAMLEERNRLARDIHDTLAQGLTGIVIQLQVATRTGPGDPNDPGSPVGLARKLAEECLVEARRSVDALRPMALEIHGLPDALRNTVDQLCEHSRVRCSFHLQGDASPLTPELEDNVLRIGQEAITNVLRHANAEQIDVTLNYEANRMSLAVKDNGSGFDTRLPRIGRYGLVGIKERAERIHGKLTLRSRPGAGTIVRISIPLTDTG